MDNDSGPIPLAYGEAPPDPSTPEAINDRLRAGSKRMDRLEEQMALNTAMTADVHEFILAWRSGFNALAKLGRGLAIVGRMVMKVIKWGGSVALACLAMYHLAQEFLRHGGQK